MACHSSTEIVTPIAKGCGAGKQGSIKIYIASINTGCDKKIKNGPVRSFMLLNSVYLHYLRKEKSSDI